jgi:hypothetical protein
LALLLACAGLLMLTAPSHALPVAFCPAGGGTITLGAGVGCTNGIQSNLYRISFFNFNTVWHCAVGKAGPQADGSSADVTTQICSYGGGANGEVSSGGPIGGVLGYARGINGHHSSFPGFWGFKEI